MWDVYCPRRARIVAATCEKIAGGYSQNNDAEKGRSLSSLLSARKGRPEKATLGLTPDRRLLYRVDQTLNPIF
jgi:hypothetical protein